MSHPFPPEKSGRAADTATAAIRKAIDDAVAAGAWLSEPGGREIQLNNIPALQFEPAVAPVATVVHFHGGAFRIGCPEQVAPFAAALAKRCNVTVLCPRYRLAPEHPFPAALNDGLAVLEAAADLGRPLFVSGDSAGGNLAASLTEFLVATHGALAGLVLLSAWLDLRVENMCYEQNAASDPMFSREAAEVAADLYLQGAPADDPRASPLLGNVAHYPPTLLNYGLGEVLAQDSRAFSRMLERAHIPFAVSAIPGMEHVAVTRGFGLPGAAETFDAVCRFVDERVRALPTCSREM